MVYLDKLKYNFLLLFNMSNNKKFEIYKAKDKAEKYYTKKNIIFDLPARILICGKSQFSGKSNLILNLLLRPEFYGNDFEGEHIFLISASTETDHKIKTLIEVKDIPPENIMEDFDEDHLTDIYEAIEQNYLEAEQEGERPPNVLFIFDDISFKGDMGKTKGVVSRLFCNGRHSNISCIITGQKYTGKTGFNTTARENATGCIIFSCSDMQLEAVLKDHNKLQDKKQFKKMFRDVTKEQYSFMVINYTNPFEELYLDKNFNQIDYKKYSNTK